MKPVTQRGHGIMGVFQKQFAVAAGTRSAGGAFVGEVFVYVAQGDAVAPQGNAEPLQQSQKFYQ